MMCFPYFIFHLFSRNSQLTHTHTQKVNEQLIMINKIRMKLYVKLALTHGSNWKCAKFINTFIWASRSREIWDGWWKYSEPFKIKFQIACQFVLCWTPTGFIYYFTYCFLDKINHEYGSNNLNSIFFPLNTDIVIFQNDSSAKKKASVLAQNIFLMKTNLMQITASINEINLIYLQLNWS